MSSLAALKERVFHANTELPKRGLVLYTFGNVSGIDENREVFVIKPSGVPYDELTPKMMVAVKVDGTPVENEYRPSSDTPTHAYLYRTYPAIGGIVHTHSTYATAWAQAMSPIPCYGTTHADHVPGDVPCTNVICDDQIAGDYEVETGVQIAECLARTGKHPEQVAREITMMLVACHGPFTWGATPEKAVYASVVLEEIAKMASITRAVNPHVGRIPDALLAKHYERKHGTNASYGQ